MEESVVQNVLLLWSKVYHDYIVPFQSTESFSRTQFLALLRTNIGNFVVVRLELMTFWTLPQYL